MRLGRSPAWCLLVALAPACASPGPAAPPPQPSTVRAPVAEIPPPPAPSSAAPTPPPAPTAEATPPRADEDLPPLPAGFVRIAEMGETLCAGLRVQVLQEPGGMFRRFVRVLGPDGKQVYEAHGRRYTIDTSTEHMSLWGEVCGDLTGDGVPELLLTERTEGAHCCYTHYAVSMTKPARVLLFWEKGDAGTPIVPVKYLPGPTWQIEGSVVMWPPFDTEKGDPALSYASAPIVPVVFSLVGGEYKATSLSFPQAYRRQRDALNAACEQDPGQCYGEIITWIDALVIGDWDAEKAKLEDADLRAALDRRAGAMKDMLKKQLGSMQRPISVNPKP